jgi:hypothetical protein
MLSFKKSESSRNKSVFGVFHNKWQNCMYTIKNLGTDKVQYINLSDLNPIPLSPKFDQLFDSEK